MYTYIESVSYKDTDSGQLEESGRWTPEDLSRDILHNQGSDAARTSSFYIENLSNFVVSIKYSE